MDRFNEKEVRKSFVYARLLGNIMLGLPTSSISPVLKQVTFYVMSSNDQMGMKIGNYWTTLDDFPVYTSHYWYLTNENHGKDGWLSLTSPHQTFFP